MCPLRIRSYISKVDVLKILVMANYKYIPSLDDILEMSAVTRLRNQLLEAEHYQLAVEVSGRSGSRPGGRGGVWSDPGRDWLLCFPVVLLLIHSFTHSFIMSSHDPTIS